jgi:hypothetical protein
LPLPREALLNSPVRTHDEQSEPTGYCTLSGASALYAVHGSRRRARRPRGTKVPASISSRSRAIFAASTTRGRPSLRPCLRIAPEAAAKRRPPSTSRSTLPAHRSLRSCPRLRTYAAPLDHARRAIRLAAAVKAPRSHGPRPHDAGLAGRRGRYPAPQPTLNVFRSSMAAHGLNRRNARTTSKYSNVRATSSAPAGCPAVHGRVQRGAREGRQTAALITLGICGATNSVYRRLLPCFKAPRSAGSGRAGVRPIPVVRSGFQAISSTQRRGAITER